jgi:hypothetical protein
METRFLSLWAALVLLVLSSGAWAACSIHASRCAEPSRLENLLSRGQGAALNVAAGRFAVEALEWR